jgi:transposase
MLSFSTGTQVFLAVGGTDLRKSFDTLAGVVRQHLGRDPLSGHLFVFCNRRRNRIKILFWDRTGWWLCAKRLEAGTFAWPKAARAELVVSAEELTLLLGGLDLKEVRSRGWYQK